MGLAIGAGVDIDVAAVLGRLDDRLGDIDERMTEYLHGRRALAKRLFGVAQVPAAMTRPLLVDLVPNGLAPGTLWEVQSIVIAGDSPISSVPGSSSPLDLNSGVVAAAPATVTMPAVPGETNVLYGLVVTGLGATAATVVTGTITGVQGGTQQFFVTVPAGVGTAITPVTLNFPGGLFATGPNVAIVVSVPSFGAGNTNAELATTGAVVTGSTLGEVTAAAFIGQPEVPYDFVAPPDMAGLIAPNIVVPGMINLPNKEVCKGTDHLYVLVGQDVQGVYSQVFVTANVLEAVDRPDTLSWL